jgi:predicted secreted acid phosphatase
MYKKFLTAALICGSIFLNPVEAATVSGYENLDFYKRTLIMYHDSGRYDQDLRHADEKALAYLQHRLAHRKLTEKLAVVLDIDETSLSNYRDMVQMSFGGTLTQITAAENQGTDEAILPTLEIYRLAKANHVAVFFITGRTDNNRRPTVRNLEHAGFTGFDGIIMKPTDYNLPSVVPYKSGARKQLAEQGYTIVMSVGDQFSDLNGGYAEKTFKLPNPYYFIS